MSRETAGQRAMAGARLANATVGRPAGCGPKPTPTHGDVLSGRRVQLTVAQAAKLTGASVRGVEAAKAVIAFGNPELVARVEDGSITLTAAERIIRGLPTPRHWSEQRTALYRHYAADGTLLYVGISTGPERRARVHARESSWVDLAVSFTGQWYDTWEAAKAAETEAIKTERPLFNIAENGS